MAHAFRNHRYFSWGWLLWFGIVLLFFSSSGNRGYTYSAHQKYHRPRRSEAFGLLDARYAKGEITQEQHAVMKSALAKDSSAGCRQRCPA